MMLIDELPALGKLEDLPKDIAAMAGHGLDYTLIVQGLDQLKATDKDHYGTIIANCAYKWYCNIGDLESAKYLSESLGEKTVRTASKNFSSGSSGGGESQGESMNYGEKGRRLLTPDEILRLGRDVAIVMQPEGRPMYVKPIDYWNLTSAFARLLFTHLKLYWVPPLIYDENPLYRKPPPGGQAGANGQDQSGARWPGKMAMSEKEARAILDVGPDAKRDEISAAYKRLMKHFHPDMESGSTYLASQINAAKEVLLGQ
jgi:hypothetical protein